MCGVAVALNWSGAEAAVRRLIEGMVHRGDVSDPVFSPHPRCAMATRRLRIVDADHASQPQLSFDGRIAVAFNGEIYNHRLLRSELENEGARFKTNSDTEVLASALGKWGPRALAKLNGMYAFVALDLRTGDFLAARDPLGVKPLYLAQHENGLLFCSEIRPLLSGAPASDALLLPPGHMLSGKGLTRYKASTPDPKTTWSDFAASELDGLLASAVQSRIPENLPFALLFSGGIDSTLMTHYAREVRPEAPGYFLGAPDAPDYPYAADYAERAKLDLRIVEHAAPERTPELVRAIVSTTETFEPNVVRDGLCNYLLFQRIGQDGFRVALSGEGADELFAGYAPLEFAFAQSEEAGLSLRAQTMDLMHRTNLQRLDRCGLRFQVEAREPYLDPAIVACALALRGSALVRMVDGAPRGKAPLRAVCDLYPERLPASIAERRKTALHVGSGFDASQKESPWIAFAQETISDADLADGQKQYAAYGLTSKEELLYMRALCETFDVRRVPHLAARTYLRMPVQGDAAAASAKLSNFLVEAQ